MDISRNPEQYELTNHAYNKAKQRDIPFELVSNVIQNGDISDAEGDNCKLFVNESHLDILPVGVVANVDTKEIITIEWQGRRVD